MSLLLFTPLNFARSCTALQMRSLGPLQGQNTTVMSEPFYVQTKQHKVTLTSVRAIIVAVED